jgi:iron complex outermembrane receptor protein
MSVDVTGRQTLRSINNILTVKDAFVKVPGVIVDNRFNQSQGDKITIRGIGTRSQFGVRGIKLLLDGIPLTLPDGQSSLNNLNIEAVKRIDIIKGPSSVLYGNASGGVIYFDSKPKSISEFYITPGITGGSFNIIRGDVDMGGFLLNGNYSINAYISVSDGFRNHSNARSSGINLTTDHDLSGHLNLAAVFNYYNSPYLLNPSSLNKEDSKNKPEKVRSFILSQGAGKSVSQFQTGFKLGYKLGTSSKFTAAVYGAARSLFNSIPGRIIELERLTGGIRTEYNTHFNLSGSSAQLTAGIDYEYQFDSRTEFINQGVDGSKYVEPENILDNIMYGDKILEQNEKVTGIGLFVIIEVPVAEKLVVSAGARYDNFLFSAEDKFLSDGSDDSGEKTMHEVSPIIGFNYNFFQALVVYGNYSTSFQTPTTNEFSNNPDGSGGFNQNLQPEWMNIIEGGLRGFVSDINLYYNTAAYILFIKNMLIPYQIENESNEEVYYRNAGASRNIGFEVSLQWQPRLNYYIAASYSFMNFKYDLFIVEESIDDTPAEYNLAGKYVPGIPKNILNIVSGYNVLPNVTAELKFNWTDSYYANDFNGPKPGSDGNENDYINDAYITLGLSFLYTPPLITTKLNFKVGIENLFDVRYNGSIVPNASGNNFFEPASVRAVYASVSISI